MTPEYDPLSGGQKTYLFLLRSLGWFGLLFVPFFAFGWATGNAQFGDYLPLVAAASAPGILVSLLLTGTPNRPTFLLRPTSFLKAFFVCGFAISIVSMAIMVEVFALTAAIDTSSLFAMLGAPNLDQLFHTTMIKVYGVQDTAALRAGFGFDFIAAMFLTYPGIIIANLASIVAWFVRFPKHEIPARAIVDHAAPAAYNEEKARALRAMRKRLNERSTA